MSEYQITRWHDIPSMVVARQDAIVVKILLANRFQESIDEAAMRMGEIDADAYTSGWIRDPWQSSEESPQLLAEKIARELEEKFTQDYLQTVLDSLGTR